MAYAKARPDRPVRLAGGSAVNTGNNALPQVDATVPGRDDLPACHDPGPPHVANAALDSLVPESARDRGPTTAAAHPDGGGAGSPMKNPAEDKPVAPAPAAPAQESPAKPKAKGNPEKLPDVAPDKSEFTKPDDHK